MKHFSPKKKNFGSSVVLYLLWRNPADDTRQHKCIIENKKQPLLKDSACQLLELDLPFNISSI